MSELTHMSLYSGIGGLDLAAEMAGFETIGQCEYADFPYKILCKHWKDVPKWRDIRDVTNESFRTKCGGVQPTVISGGFPCQPHSLAGKRKGSSDERDLWGEFARVICEIKPRWVVGENVVGLLSTEFGRFFGRVLRDLSELGYNASWGVWGAYQAGAPHRRNRVFIIANANSELPSGVDKGKQKQFSEIVKKKLDCTESWTGFNAEQNSILRDGERSLYIDGGVDIRNDDGLSEGLDRITALGNAVVPQQAYPIFKAIADIEQMMR